MFNTLGELIMKIKFLKLLLFLAASLSFSTVYASFSPGIWIRDNGTCSVQFTAGPYFSTSGGRHNIRKSQSGEINANCKWDPVGKPATPRFEELTNCWVTIGGQTYLVNYNDATLSESGKLKLNCHSSD